MLELYRLLHNVIQQEVVPVAFPPQLEVRAYTDTLQYAGCRDNCTV